MIDSLDREEISGWVVKPGENAFFWNECLTRNVHRLGFDDLVDRLTDLNNLSRDEISFLYKETYPHVKSEKSHILHKYFESSKDWRYFFRG